MKYQLENHGGEFDYRSRSHNGWIIKENIHDYSELLYCEKGEGIAIINGQRIHLKENHFIWIPPNYVHRFDFPDGIVICAVFSKDFVPLFFKKQKGRNLVVKPLCADNINSIFKNLPHLKKDDHCLICAHLNLILHEVIKNSSFEDVSKSDGALYQKIISYISNHYTEDISLGKIARMFGYNEKYLSHTLHHLTGIHFRQFLTSYRINYAKTLLINEAETDMTTIAMKCGFSAINTFYRAFRESVGMTPTEYKRECKKTPDRKKA